MAIKKGGLGRGLDALIPDKSPSRDHADSTTPEINEKVNKAEKSLTGTKASNQTRTAGPGKSAGGTKNSDSDKAKSKKSDRKAVENPKKQPDAESALREALQNVSALTLSETKLKLSQIEPNREQPRKRFKDEGLKELADSIRQHGVVQPLLVQKKGDFYEIIAGERRWRAARLAGLKEVPVTIRDYTKQERVEISLIENLQREDLNPIEEAEAYQLLMQDFGLSQEKVAERVSKSRPAIANSLRLLKLKDSVREYVIEGVLSEGHARALLGLPSEELQELLAEQAVREQWNVRQTEKAVRALAKPAGKRQVKKTDEQLLAVYHRISEELKGLYGTRVEILPKNAQKGKIEIEYYSGEELERIVDLLKGAGEKYE